MRAVLLIDFGSTYTKLTAVDIENAKILGTAASYTTVESDINEGLNQGLSILKDNIGDIRYEKTLACSSAAGADIRGGKDGYARSRSQDNQTLFL